MASVLPPERDLARFVTLLHCGASFAAFFWEEKKAAKESPQSKKVAVAGPACLVR
jgi:hypothetical protein